MNDKIVKIDLSSDRLICVASDLVDGHDYIGALKMLNKNARINGNDSDSYMLYAEIYDDLGLFEKSINNWYAYLDFNKDDGLYEAFEGLAVSYMNLGLDQISAYYYGKLLAVTGEELDAQTKREIMDSFLRREPSPLKFVYPPELADCSDIISDGIDKMRNGEYDGAIEEFDKVDENNGAYLSARNYIAMCNIIADKCEEAEAECLAVLKKYPDNVQALTTLAAVKTEQKKSKESADLARELLKLNVTSSDDIYKIATVCCENGLHEEAYTLFCKLDEELEYDPTIMFFKAVSAFNCGKIEQSFDAFDRLITVNPSAVVAKYYYELARKAKDNGEQLTLGYFYRLPKEKKEQNLKLLSAVDMLSESDFKKLCGAVDITECIKWCFDEYEGRDVEDLQFIAASCAIRAGLDELVRSMLLNAFLSERFKVRVLTLLCGRNVDDSFGIVVCHQFKRVSFRAISVGRKKRKNFVFAYARIAGHFSVLDNVNSDKFASTAEKVYYKLEQKGALDAVTDIPSLSAVLFHLSGVKEPKLKKHELPVFFEANPKKIDKLMTILTEDI
ncbi:MAG: hypothetical protein K2L12_00565 [Clostridia bacterium]|nr:hypothetical protein [Clostridia bacterium]